MNTQRIASTADLAEAVASNPDLARRIRDDPEGVIRSIARPLANDRFIYRAVVIVLSLAVMLTIVGALVFGYNGKSIPDVVVAIGSASVGALGGLLAPPPRR